MFLFYVTFSLNVFILNHVPEMVKIIRSQHKKEESLIKKMVVLFRRYTSRVGGSTGIH
jgi:hypothetical protein